jgi:Holliday junction resolvase RusA-like endonuclease
MRGHNLFETPCRIEIDVLCSVPASWSQLKQRQALEGTLRPAKTPDADNVLKAICDGINGVVWKDDVLAVEGCWTKIYADIPGVRVRVAKLTDIGFV